MPRQGKTPQTVARERTNQLMWGQYGVRDWESLTSWDIKQVSFVQALLEIVASGSAVVLRPGSGGRAIGISIWEGDVRHPATWVYDSIEADAWADAILQRVRSQDAAD